MKSIGIDKATISILPFIFSGLFVSMALLMPQFDIEKQLRNRLLYGMRFIALSSILLLLSPSYNGIIVYLNFHFRSWDNIIYTCNKCLWCQYNERSMNA